MKWRPLPSRFIERLNWLSGGSTIRRSLISALVFALSVAFTQMASAQPFSGSQGEAHQLPAYCEHSMLTGAKFMQSIQTIIDHGDLTDVAFIEKTFGTKFSVSYGMTPEGNPDHQNLTYTTDEVLGGVIHVDLQIELSRTQQLQFRSIAFMRIEARNSPIQGPEVIRDCLHIRSPAFIVFFKGGFFPGVTVGVLGRQSPTGYFYKYPPSPGKNGSKLELIFSYEVGDKLVTDVSINQAP